MRTTGAVTLLRILPRILQSAMGIGLCGLCGVVALAAGGCGSTSTAHTTVVVTATPTRTPQATPTPPSAPTTSPPPATAASAQRATSSSQLGIAPPNPWGYSFTPGNLIETPPESFCAYFVCTPNFGTAHGYLVQCEDGVYSMSGGLAQTCAYDGGQFSPLYTQGPPEGGGPSGELGAVPGNPWGYDFAPGQLIYNAPPSFCAYFPCTPNFGTAKGYIAQCNDGVYSMSGGLSNACSADGGQFRPLYAH